jgi:hypothetical protein
MGKVALVLGGEPEGEGEEMAPSSKGYEAKDSSENKAVRVEALKAFGEALKAGNYSQADDLWEEYRAACEEV